MSLELTFAGVYSCWRHGVEYFLLSPLGVWQRWEGTIVAVTLALGGSWAA